MSCRGRGGQGKGHHEHPGHHGHHGHHEHPGHHGDHGHHEHPGRHGHHEHPGHHGHHEHHGHHGHHEHHGHLGQFEHHGHLGQFEHHGDSFSRTLSFDWSQSFSPIPSQVSNQVINPILPYVSTIPGGIKKDMAVFLQGTLLANAKWFVINFQTGKSVGDDIAFNYNPRIGCKTCLNSFKKGCWEKEEYASDKPFIKGGNFQIFIHIKSDSYEVYLNGVKHCTFKHRIPLEKVSTLNVNGDISLHQIGFIQEWTDALLFTRETKYILMSSGSWTIPLEISAPISNPALPYVGQIPGGIKQDKALVFQGNLHADANCFAINFKTGPSEGDDIAFHYNPRIGDITALNSFRNGSWENEESLPGTPFTKGADFIILVVINSEGYEVFVNGVKHCTFKHRTPLENVSTVNIHGDISLLVWGFIDSWSTTSSFKELKTIQSTQTPITLKHSEEKEKKSILMSSGSSKSIPLVISAPVSNPALPYVGQIPGGIKQDKAVVFQGNLHADATRFEINFKTGPSEGDNIAFHYNPRIGDITALNSFRNGSWENEESLPGTPFTKGAAFIILCVINSEGYEVFVNSVKHCTFKHRIPLEKVSTVNIRGDISLLVWGFIDSWSTTSSFKELKTIQSTQTPITLKHSEEKEKKSILMSSGSSKSIPLVISAPVSNPALPYVGQIPGGIKHDKAVVFQGNLHADATRFEINFKTGPSEGDNIAFHYNPRIGGITALNSFRNGSWENEESLPGTPFTKGAAFIILCVINSEGYEVFVNSVKHCTFKHRIPLEKVSTVNIRGDISLLVWGFIDSWSTTSSFKELKTIQSTQTPITLKHSEEKEKKSILMSSGSSKSIPLVISAPVSNPALPYVGQIPGGIKQDKAVVFQGNLHADATRFEINFKTGPSEGDNIAFHYNPRIGGITALNSFRNGSWENEESLPGTPFTKGAAFIILCVINSEGYEVFVNSVKHCTFKHRIPLEKVSTVNIRGDISLLVWGFIDSWSTTSSFKELKTIQSTQTPITLKHSEEKEKKSILMSSGSSKSIPLVISAPVSNPALPYVGQIPGGIKQDKAVVFQGNLHADATRFEINFKTGPSEGDNIAFHYNPRIGGITALNSFRNGSWENEESLPGTPFTKGAAFIILCVINSEGYEVFVNSVKHCTFKHRIPLEKVSTVNIRGDISLLVWGFIDSWSTTSSFKELKTIQSTQTPITLKHSEEKEKKSILMSSGSSKSIPLVISAPVSNPALPYVGQIPGGIKQDKAVVFQGNLHADATRFEINFKTGPSEGDNIAFHYNPRIGGITALNSFRNGSWENEESLPGTPFTKGAAFIILCVINSEGYEVFVNSVKHCTFKHRIPLEKVSTVNIRGDISLLVWGFIDSWSTTSSFKELKTIQSTQTPITLKHSEEKEKKSILMSSGSSKSIPLVISAPVSNPALPYVGQIPGGIKQDKAVVFQGNLHADATRFEINFKTGPSEGDNIAFHYNPRIGGITALNSFRNGSWENEESLPGTPFTKGAAFIILCVINSEGYEVFVNSVKHCTFKHRIPMEKVSTVNIRGDISLLVWGFIDSWSTTSSFKELKTIQSTQTPITLKHSEEKEKKSILMSSGSSKSIPLVISAPVSNPALPYVGQIPGGIKQDKAVVFQGNLHADATRFEINFKTGPSEGDNIAFHYNPRIGGITALNSFRNGSWENEESLPGTPFTKGAAFIILCVINSEGYEVFVNSVKHCTFKHRIPMEKVSTVNIRGDISLLVWGFIDSWSTTSSFKELKTIQSTQTPITLKHSEEKEKKSILMSSGSSKSIPLVISAPVSNPALPYVGQIPGGIKQDKAVVFQGNLHADATRFEINFKTGPSEGDNIAFHYNPRIGGITALNSFRNGSWENEESLPGTPFTKGAAFIILCVINSEGYEVFVNSVKHCTFKHRIPLEKVSTVNIRGDISLLVWGFIDSWSTTSSFKELKTIQSTQTPITLKHSEEKEKKSILMSSGSSKSIPLVISAPVSNPALPYVGQIPGGIKQDKAVVFQGNLHADATRFEINFKTGPSEGDNIAFHYNPRIGGITALNSFRNGSWENEESLPGTPFTKGAAFIILCVINSEGYEVFVNSVKHCTFKHRIPMEKVSTVNIRGDISLLVWGFIDSWSTTSSFKELKTIQSTQTPITLKHSEEKEKKSILMSSGSSKSIPLVISAPVSNPALPYVGQIPGGIKQDKAVVFQGNLHADATRFEINFKTGPSEGDNIAFHYNPRIGGITALNSFRNGSWENEESLPGTPFTKGAAFIILCVINSEGYEVFVNSVKHCTFKHRIPMEKVSTVNIRGDISLLVWGFIDSWSTTSSFKELKTIQSTQTPITLKHSEEKEKKSILMSSGSSKSIPLVISAPVSNPALPYVGQIPGGIKQDKAVVFQGNLHADATRFEINFKTGPSEGDNIAFHYNPRIGGITALNSFRNGSWENEESLPGTPFTKGAAFIILCVINSEGYEVFVNSVKHCTFKHRIPMEKVSTVNIRGDISLLVWGFIDSWSTTSSFKELKTIQSTQTPITLKHSEEKEKKSILMSSGSSKSIPLVISAPVSNPALPYVGQIPGGIKQDKAVVFQGNLHADATRFEINFKTGPSEGDNIAFHYNPRIGGITALNSFRNGSWENEESLPGTPFTKGAAFIILCVINSEGYEVFVNSVKHCTFKHRIPLEKVSTVNIRGDISLLVWGFIDSWSTTSSFKELKTIQSTQTPITLKHSEEKEKKSILMSSGSSKSIPLVISAPVSNPALPYVGQIPGGIKQDKAVVFQGNLHADATRFEINFKTGPSEGDNIAFHYNPRIGGITALNSFRNGSWENEESLPGTPFTKGAAFIILCVINSEGYEVFVNSVKHCTFKHRIPLEKVSTVNIRGDISLLVWGFIDSWSTTSSFKELKTIQSTQTPITLKQSEEKEKKSILMSSGSLKFIPLLISAPVSNPALPYVGQIPGGIKQDKALVFQGNLHADAMCFAINFKTGPSEGDDIAFHYNPRIGDITALNSFRNGSWENEESLPGTPFTKGADFIILVVINSEGYEVFVNGVKHCTFKHCFPLEKVSTVNIHGDISLLVWGFIDSWSTTSSFKELKTIQSTQSSTMSSKISPLEISHPVIYPSLPYVAKVPGGIHQNKAIFIQGVVPVDALGFNINFKTGPANSDDIAFHYNPRIGSSTALNSFRNGNWETEEAVSDKPFTKGGSFQMIIVIKSDSYEVYVNGIKHCVFKHRIPLEKVSTLDIQGNLSQLICGFINTWSTSSFFTELQKITVPKSSPTAPGFIPFQVSHPVNNPALPYVGKIPGGIKPDMAVFLQGSLTPDAKNFTVDFTAGSDIAFHYNPQLGSYTSMNSFINNIWGAEQKESDKPYTKGAAFQMIIVINSDGYEVYVNGLKQYVFKHRIPLEKVSGLELHGDLSQILCGFIYSWKTSTFFTEIQKVTVKEISTPVSASTPLQISNPINNPALPYAGKIPGGIKPDMAVFFQGSLTPDAKNFTVDFTAGSDIAFHYKPQLGSYTSMNSFINNIWGAEQKESDKPYTKGEAFQMIIVINSDGYEVYVNGLKQYVFKHRIPLEKVSGLELHGDLSQILCGFIYSWKTSSFFTETQTVTEISTTVSESTPFQISNPINNPALPYVGKIPGGIKPDMAVFFQGSLTPDANNFSINFKTGPSNSDDIAFQYNPQIGSYTALNSFRNGKWETEEVAPDKPFTKGGSFQMIIAIKSDDYEVYVNGSKHCVFKHRIPLEKVSTLDIQGNLTQLICGFINGWSTSSFFKEIQKITSTYKVSKAMSFNISDPITNPTIPYVGKIPNGLKKDMAVIFQGSVPQEAKGFIVNFKTGPSDNDDIAFHFNPCIGENTIMNSFRNGNWEKKEIIPGTPFTRGNGFQMIVLINSKSYEVYVNGLNQWTFNHRIPLEKVVTLCVTGDVTIQLIGFDENCKVE